jgi:hypothetical protein
MDEKKEVWEWQEEPAALTYPRELFIELLIEAGALPSEAARLVDSVLDSLPVVQ